jgi:hypothetical protein
VEAPDELGTTGISKLFVKSDGSPRSREDAIRLFGHGSVWVAELNQALEARLASAPPLSVPPRIFVSHRWSGDAENEGLANLVATLRERATSSCSIAPTTRRSLRSRVRVA